MWNASENGPCHMQILNHVGVLNLPIWWEAGKVAQDKSPIPFSEPFLPHWHS